MSCSVSVITPSYNQGRFIERTIQSVLSQKAPGGLEYLVLDGGSSDETVDILKKYTSRLSWVSEPDDGQPDAVNKGLARATGEVIGWLNSDDIYCPGAVAVAADYLASHQDVDVVYGEGEHIDEDDRVIERYPTESWNLDRLKETCYLCQPAVFFRKAVFERFGGLDVRLQYAMDYEYWMRLGIRGVKFARIPQVLAGSRLHEGTKTLGSRVECHAEINEVMRLHLKRVPDPWLFNYAHAVLDSGGVLRSNRRRFAIAVSLLSVYAALRWNRRVSGDMARTVAVWIKGACQNLFRRENLA